VSSSEPAPLQLATRQSWYPWLVVGVTCIGGFIGQLDASIVQLALPTFEREFHANLDTVSWVAIAYLLAFASTLPIFARLSETKGRKLLYLAGYAIFTLASGLCSAAPSLRLLIAFRVIQGIGGALLGANSITISGESCWARKARARHGNHGGSAGSRRQRWPRDRRFAPAKAGLALDLFGVGSLRSWQASFSDGSRLPQTAESTSSKRFDWWGALLLTPALTSIVLDAQ
jgi:MFS family permease